MANDIWKRLKKPIYILAPMAGVTNSVFRRVIARHGRPDLFYTEFVSCAGLCSTGRDKILPDLDFQPEEKPIIAQVFGRDPDEFARTAELVAELGYDGIDINTGCPDKSVQKQGAGAMLMREPELAKKIIAATKRGAGDLPVSVKTRIGYHRENLDDWLKQLLEAEPAAVAIHWRTKRQMYKGDARWDLAPRAVEIARDMGSNALIIGNGDVKSLPEAAARVRETGVDGVMIGRAIFNNPWLFNPDVDPDTITWRERIQAMMEHLELFESVYGDRRHFLMIRKHIKSYISGFRDAKDLRIALQQCKGAEEMRATAADFIACR